MSQMREDGLYPLQVCINEVRPVCAKEGHIYEAVCVVASHDQWLWKSMWGLSVPFSPASLAKLFFCNQQINEPLQENPQGIKTTRITP